MTDNAWFLTQLNNRFQLRRFDVKKAHFNLQDVKGSDWKGIQKTLLMSALCRGAIYWSKIQSRRAYPEDAHQAGEHSLSL